MIINRKITSYSIDQKVIEKFNELAKQLGSNKSQVIQLLIERWIVENENK